jgi:hypothetical protein
MSLKFTYYTVFYCLLCPIFVLMNLLFYFLYKYYNFITFRKVKYLQLGICAVMSTRAVLQKKVENMFLMM